MTKTQAINTLRNHLAKLVYSFDTKMGNKEKLLRIERAKRCLTEVKKT